MAWIEVHQSLRDHRKILALADELDMPEPHVAGHCLYLWLWSLDNAPDGVLPNSRRILARAASWTGDAAQFVDALLATGMLDRSEDGTLRIHDWDDYAGKIADRRERNKQAMRAAREREKLERVQHVDNTSTPRDATSKATVPNPTLQYTTVPLEHPTDGDIDTKPREYAPSARKMRSSVRSPSAQKKEKTTAEKTPKESAPRERPRNEIWDAIAVAIGYEPKTRTEQSNWGKVCAELKEAGATPEEVGVRTARYIRRYGRAMLTVNALLTHWGECEIDVPIAQNGHGGLTDAEARAIATQEREAAQNRKEAEFQRRYEAAMLYAADE